MKKKKTARARREGGREGVGGGREGGREAREPDSFVRKQPEVVWGNMKTGLLGDNFFRTFRHNVRCHTRLSCQLVRLFLVHFSLYVNPKH
jgi:hypothetical protein